LVTVIANPPANQFGSDVSRFLSIGHPGSVHPEIGRVRGQWRLSCKTPTPRKFSADRPDCDTHRFQCFSDGSGDLQFRPFGIGEEPRAGVEGLAFGAFEREGAAAAFDDVDDQLGMLPVLVL
jgi:hypothetical protein